LIGEVRGTDLDGQKFWLRLSDGHKILGRFEPEQERLILEALGRHRSRRLRLSGIAQYSSTDGSLEQVVQVNRVEVLSSHSIEDTQRVGKGPSVKELTSEVPVWQQITELGASLPDQVWEALPNDLSENIDKYLYGGKDAS
jgi:hypothetical protein